MLVKLPYDSQVLKLSNYFGTNIETNIGLTSRHRDFHTQTVRAKYFSFIAASNKCTAFNIVPSVQKHNDPMFFHR